MPFVGSRGLLAAVAASLISIAPAAADENVELTRAAMRTFAAMRGGDVGEVVGRLDATVAFDLDASACGKPYRRPGKAKGKARRALASCLVTLFEGGELRDVEVTGGPREVMVVTDRGSFVLVLAASRAELKVARIRIVTATEVWDGDEGGG